MLLTNKEVQNAHPDSKMYRLRDGNALFLQVEPNGKKYWRLRYRFATKAKMLALGCYPEVSLAEAREKAIAARKTLASGVDPSSKKKEDNCEYVARPNEYR